jgi:16S rRNA processing protein RimM
LRAPDRLILMGVFGAPQGVRGEIRVKSLSGNPGAIGAYGPLTDKARARTFAFESLRPLKDDMAVARLAGVSTREAAEALKGVEIFARRDQLPPPAHDEFYVDDLVGLEAVGADGARLGRVVSLMNYGAGDILEIAPAEGGETLLLPFTKSVILEVDFAAGAITVARPREI